MASVAGFIWMWAATRGAADAAVVGAARAARRIHGAHPLAEPAVRAAARASTRCGCSRAAAATGDTTRVSATRSPAAPRSSPARVVGFLPQMLAWQAIYGSFDRAVSGRAADPLDGSAPRRHPLVGAQRALQHGARSSISARSASSAFAFARPAVGMPRARVGRRDDLLQRLHPGLVGQRRVRRAPLRRRDPALLRRARRVHRLRGAASCGGTRPRPSPRCSR